MELDRERAELCRTIAGIEAATGGPDVTTAEGRVALFTSLFRGRPDVFATRWESTKSPGKTGWSPRCLNEWRPGVCEKPRVKCADCGHRRFVAWSEAEARRHLEGRQVAGIYPLLANETCWLVAIDLDGPGWRDDVGALRDSARELNIPVLVERSRSGNGAHLWVLFTRPVGARVARAIGSLLLTRAMHHRSISMASYDRLFPNQDTMPAGGFGNLIALPLQHARRGDGCTVFLDSDLEPWPDQWLYLADVQRLDSEQAEQIAADAEDAGGTLGLPERAVTKARSRPRQLTPAPSGAIEVCLTGRVEIPTAGMSADLRDRLRRTAAFANPEFFERERARLSTHQTPRVIACHEDTDDRLILPRGCLGGVVDELETAGTAVTIRDERSPGTPISVTFAGTLTGPQRAAVKAMAAHETGVLVAPPGAGKTVMATALIANRARSTLVLVHRRPLLEQWISRLAEFLDISCDQIGSPAKAPGASGIDVVMVQTLTRREGLDLSRYGHVIVDECHHVPAFSVERLLRELPARAITGLTATPQRRDGHHPIITMQCGPVRHTLTRSEQVETATRRVLIARDSGFDPVRLPVDPGIQEVLSAVAADASRTRRIAADAIAELSEDRYPLVLTERREHLNAIAELITAETDRVVVLHGGMGVKARRRSDEVLTSDGPRVVLATGRYIGEGFDDPRLDTLILAMPIAWKGTMTQYAGRLHRHHDTKHEIRIVDYVDHAVPVLRRMYAKRQRAYTSLGYKTG
ncbi:DEAD/DEAH box helicase [Paraconexibacter antarcticus]|uniref:DEAD/DEAH box helicase n=1 Tax=Paraconexibacter antarcticus TaxID=2949664 RepID=A0ABY5DPA0_9ACTN|nr:DEAD/DEAH box helicase [Paraconexibacter antarcticus]UTI63863.1 DEAD/DEAH box helicase [Paraconexibacter antarcticus]